LKKILFYSGSKESGGAEHYLSVISSRIPRDRYLPVLASNLDPLRFFFLLKREKPDLVHFNLGLPIHCAANLLVSGLFRGVKITATVHSVAAQSSRFPFLSRLKKLIALASLRGVQRFICVSQNSKETFCRNYGISTDKVAVIYNGVDMPPDAAFGTSGGTVVIGTVCRLVKNKGLEVLLKAFSLLLKDLSCVRLLLVGDGPKRKELEGMSKQLGIESKVTFTGHAKNILPLLCGMDIFVMPSLSESLPFSLLEAMAAGRAVISTDVGGIRELIKEGENGYVVPPGDPDKLSDAASKLLADPAKSSALAIAAKRTIAEKFSIDSMMRGTEQFFDEA